MKVTLDLTNNCNNYRNRTFKNFQDIQQKDISKNSEEIFTYPANFYTLNFQGGVPLNKLYEEYNWYINCDRTPAIYSFLKMDYSPEIMNKFFEELLSNDRSYQLIESIVSHPRDVSDIVEKLRNKLGENSPSLLTFVPNSRYYNAYTNYLESKYQKAKTLSELLKVRPDWSGDALMEKYKALAHNDKLKIGNIPRQIPKEHLWKIIDYLKKNMDVGVKKDKSINSLVIDGRTYNFEFFTEGKSSKNVFGVYVPAMAKKYVIKMDEPGNRSLNAPFALGTLAKIDKYLTANRSRNSAPLCYYDHEHNFSIYKYIEHSLVNDDYSTPQKIMKHLPDFKALGLLYNDTVGVKNFFTLNLNSSDTHHETEGFEKALNNSEWISVDNDHVTFSNILQPSITKYTKSLPNGMQMFF